MEIIIVILALFTGYFIGRMERGKQTEEETEKMVDNELCIRSGKGIASPVAGTVSFFCEGGKKGAVIEPMQGMLYAPMSGKITKLYPMGNSFVLCTEEGMELLIQVGRRKPDELFSMYYRPHIVQNEIINKGKLLLTFDMERLLAEGEDVAVVVSLEDGLDSSEVSVTRKEQVKVGDELMWVNMRV